MRNVIVYQDISPKFSDTDQRPSMYPRFTNDGQIRDPVLWQIMTMLEQALVQFQDDWAVQLAREVRSSEAGDGVFLEMRTFVRLQRDDGGNYSVEMHTRADTETLAEVAHVHPSPGDILVFHGISGEELHEIVERVRKIEDFPKVLFLAMPNGATLTRETLISLQALLKATT